MNRFINKVTVTGADDSVKVSDLIQLSQEYPFVEFGILLSRNAEGSCRFPSINWLNVLYRQCRNNPSVSLAGHICGSWVREIYKGEKPIDFYASVGITHMPFKRWQMNTHGIKHKFTDEAVWGFCDERWETNGASVIFQYDEVNKDILKTALHYDRGNISALFDLSHGAGILPETWPKPLDGVYCGYAGGLSPDNVAENLEKIAPLVGNRRIWIDAETHLYSNQGQQFDLEKVRNFLHNASKYVL